MVASEVKNLAGQTARSTEDISSQVEAIQEATKAAVQVVAEVGDAIQEIAAVSAGIAAAIEEQAAATKEIARNVVESSEAVHAVTNRMGDVSDDAADSRRRADEISESSAAIVENVGTLRTDIVRTIRTATDEADRRGEPRFVVALDATLIAKGERGRVRVLDMSRVGARIRCDLPVAAGDSATVMLGGDARCEVTIRSRNEDGTIGVAFSPGTATTAFAEQVTQICGGFARAA